MQQRIYYLDSLKGVLIMFVILGHVIQNCIPSYEMNFAFRFIYSFHMPLFFFVSGYLANRSKYDSSIFFKKFTQLLLPFLTWAFISPFLYTGVFNLSQSFDILIYPDKGLWFLYNLFFYCVIFNVAEFLKEKLSVPLLLGIVFFIIILFSGMYVFHTKFNFTQLCYHIVFFTLGYFFKTINSKMINNKIILFIGIIYAFTVPFWTTNGSPLFYSYLNLGTIISYLYRYLVQIFGLLFFFQLFKFYFDRENKCLATIGKSTLGIYAFQFVVIYYLLSFVAIQNILLKIITITVLTILICYFIVCMVRRFKYFRLFIIGEK